MEFRNKSKGATGPIGESGSFNTAEPIAHLEFEQQKCPEPIKGDGPIGESEKGASAKSEYYNMKCFGPVGYGTEDQIKMHGTDKKVRIS